MAQRRPGPGLTVSLAVLGVGAVLLVVGIAETAVPFVRTVTRSSSYPTPAVLHTHLTHGTYEIYELTAHKSSSLSIAHPGTVDIAPTDVTVTSTSGQPVTVTSEGADETLTRGLDVYTGAVQFAVPTTGSYVVEVRSATTERVILARSLGSIARSVVGWIATGAAGGLLVLIGLALLIIGLVRRRHRPLLAYTGAGAGPGALPAAGWYPDPADPGQQRFWDGGQWTDQTHRP